MPDEFEAVDDPGPALHVSFFQAVVKMAKIPSARPDEPKKLVVAASFFLEVFDEGAGPEVLLGPHKGLDQRGAASWPDPRRSAVGDEHVGGSGFHRV